MDREILREFIELYKQRPCLWNNRSANYNNRHMRLTALKELLVILKKIDHNANISSVRTKIEILRTSYNREKKKVLKSISTSNSTDDIHVPSLWYYHLLSFISETAELETTSKDNIDPLTSGCSSAAENLVETSNKKTKDRNTQQRILQIAKQVAYHSCVEDLDEFDLFGRMLAIELKKLKHPYQSIAQKLISDVLFFAKTGRLTNDSIISIPTSPSQSSPYYYNSHTPSPQLSDSNTCDE